MPKRYHQYCGIARALDVVGERWTLLIVRELLLGPAHYSELLVALQGLTTNLLAKRLAEMRRNDLVRKQSSRNAPWELTETGRGLEPVLFALGGWSTHLMGPPTPEDRFSTGWALLSFKRQRAPLGRTYCINIHSDDGIYHLAEQDGQIIVGRGASPLTTASIAAPGELLRPLLARRMAALLADERLRIDGDQALVMEVFGR